MPDLSIQPPSRPSLFWLGALCLLALPAVLMTVGADGVHWGPYDFLFAGVLLSLSGL
jgi:hypothetical protein